MTNASLQALVDPIIARGVVLESDMLPLRREIGADMHIDLEEAEILFKINDVCETPSSWPVYFTTVITTFVMDQGEPKGYVSEHNAVWLKARIASDGVVETKTELALLLNILRTAHNVTDTLEHFALDQVRLAVLHGSGYLGQHRRLQPGVIGQAEVEILRRVLYSVSSEGGMGISRMEAEMLFDLNEATAGAHHHESWQQLFVCGIANYLMVLAAYEEPDLEEALRRETWLQDPDAGIGSFSDVKFKDVIGAFREAFGYKSDEPTFTHMNQGQTKAAEAVTQAEAAWLIERMNRDGGIDANERALLEFLRVECPNIHGSLFPYLQAA
ncbi:hypothetical protein ACJ3XI_04670 [Litorimonas sp. RW-G-Af-16]|uniref:hypothetical protein n=1 Tax=Litorimonas sp. RW-G-Af-16 TaxID=3241168 RepID=UPI00390CC605